MADPTPAEIAELAAQIERIYIGTSPTGRDVAAALRAQQKRIAKLEEALRPFAEEALELATAAPDDGGYRLDALKLSGEHWPDFEAEFTVGDCRRALAVRRRTPPMNDPADIERHLTKAQRRALKAMAQSPAGEWLTCRSGGFTEGGAYSLYWTAPWEMVERDETTTPMRYRATPLGREVAKHIQERRDG